jgi:L-malate glycosyltransferase
MKSKHSIICHIISGDLWAGAEVMAFHLLKSIAGFPELKIIAIILNEGRLASEIGNLGLEVHLVDEKINSFPQLFLKMLKLLKNRPIDIIHTHRYKENILSFLLSIVLRRPKRIATLHGMPEFQKNSFTAHGFVNRLNSFLLSRYFHATVPVSHEMRNTLESRHGFKADSIKVIHNGIPVPEKPRQRSEKTDFTIGSSGRLFPVKDFRLFIEIACLLRKKDTIRFRLAGDGIEREMLASFVKERRLEDIFEMPGHIDDVDSFYGTLDLYVNTSHHEGIPMTVLEAMSYGIPVIAPRIGGLPEIVENGQEGFLIEGRAPGDFAEKCGLLYENKPLYLKFADAARSKIEKEFSSLMMARRYASAYNELLKT